MGPIMMDVHGTSLNSEDKELIEHPLVGGLILFARNYESPEQISALTQSIRTVKQDMLIAVDHEGGRVQRFRKHFSKIPAMGQLLSLCKDNVKEASLLAYHCGVLIAKEVQSVGVDISFAPVLDINDISQVIGDRAFGKTPDIVEILADGFISGMHTAGMKVTGKHFPGHGSVEADSHVALPVDSRTKQDIFTHDMTPFQHLIERNKIDALMPAHVIYPNVDSLSVGFSSRWLQEVLRESLGFQGVIFSDDLSMEGASTIGGFIERSEAAQYAGCDMLLVCNNRTACVDVIDNANLVVNKESVVRLKKMQMKGATTSNFESLFEDAVWAESNKVLNSYIS